MCAKCSTLLKHDSRVLNSNFDLHGVGLHDKLALSFIFNCQLIKNNIELLSLKKQYVVLHVHYISKWSKYAKI